MLGKCTASLDIDPESRVRRLSDGRIEDAVLELEDGWSHQLGPDLELVRCRVIIRVRSRWFHPEGSVWRDCDVEVKRPIVKHYWSSVRLIGCRFSGRLTECDFGLADEAHEGQVEDCDFSKAVLDSCRFMDCDSSRLVFPRWPCFTILQPLAQGDALQKIAWPGDGRAGSIRFGTSYRYMTGASFRLEACTEYMPSLQKFYGGSEEEWRLAVSQVPRAIY